jgi:hypothetical protein
VQIMIDTVNDDHDQLYKFGKYLVDNFAAGPAARADRREQIGRDIEDTTAGLSDAVARVAIVLPNLDDTYEAPAPVEAAAVAPPPPPPPPVTMAEVVGDSDPEVTFDDEGAVSSLTTSVDVPGNTAPPPPPTPVPPGPAVAVEYDSRGMPWDSRIHATNRAKKIGGEWKNKRGVSQDLVTACEAQNKPGNAPAPTTSAPPAAATAPPPPPPPPPTAGVAVPAAAVQSGVIDFRGLMQKIQAASAAGKLSTDQVNAALLGVGLKPEEMAALINNAPLIASVNAAIDKCLSS